MLTGLLISGLYSDQEAVITVAEGKLGAGGSLTESSTGGFSGSCTFLNLRDDDD